MSSLWPLSGHTCSIHLLLMALSMLVHFSWCFQERLNFRDKEQQILGQMLQHYNPRVLPFGAGGKDGSAITVRVNIHLHSIRAISDYRMEYSVQLTLMEQWTDERLRFNDFGGRIKYLPLMDTPRIWMPDLYFANEEEGYFHHITTPNMYIRIYPDGSVLHSVRLSLTLSCPMNLELFPLDRQICSLQITSYRWTMNDLEFMWKDIDPVQVVRNVRLPRFTLEKFRTDTCNSKTITGEYSCLKVDLFFKRQFSYYLIQIYIPCCMLVIISWVSFWLDQNAIPVRLSLGVTTILTMAIQTAVINFALLPVSYSKAIDIWTAACLIFVLGALVEFAFVNYASRSDVSSQRFKKERCQCEQERAASVKAAADIIEDCGTNFALEAVLRHPSDVLTVEKVCQCEIHVEPKRENCSRCWFSKFPTRSKRIDAISRIIFPLTFTLFNLVYWSTCLFHEGTYTN